MRDDELLRRAAVLREGGEDRELHPLGGQRLAVDGEGTARPLCPAEGAPRRVPPRLGRALRAPDPRELALVLYAAAAVEELALRRQLDAVGAQVLGEHERERVRD